ncbi:MAG: hypothetical protein A2508_09635 [Candidatus Lambdaproteobacteria bacterium RIFOXYD12_FULL_49_8]|uniref:Uncharacterized protein n=1 Tax=Candidatus Lambdaproteobacteria bacterium RIFOXYD2_FULL_50_16 TaxID=1817772 RepID=A0A1F6GF42_9PROT|nr:MAG: hypothetical protein A2527_04060 [Candidatus Lambdaproteobacteria bacterium RIFOXYD2_FULL_50_16]OGG97998.1 MAG: hypothetical protein A2508_09635 [Candidatus Lambdaproteobacteria bacterium RIFOXYD12_FULL_49_8]
MKDWILAELSKKKLALLKELHRYSQLYALNGHDLDLKAKYRALEALERTDLSIEARQDEIGILAKDQEEELYKEIKTLLVHLQALNRAGIAGLDAEKQDLLRQKRQLEQSGKLTGYLGPYKDQSLKNAPIKRGWQRGYVGAL